MVISIERMGWLNWVEMSSVELDQWYREWLRSAEVQCGEQGCPCMVRQVNVADHALSSDHGSSEIFQAIYSLSLMLSIASFDGEV